MRSDFYPFTLRLFFVLLIISASAISQNMEPLSKTVQEGERFNLELPSNHSSGFSWHYVPDENPLIDSIQVQYVLPPHALVGTAGKEIWTFTALKKGKQRITFQYKRSWENKVPAREKTFEIRIE
ncbi:MAG: protease inhibitor I42 family protein [Lutimonas sp.]